MSNITQIKTIADLLARHNLPPSPPPVVVHGYQIEPDDGEWFVITPDDDEWFFDTEAQAVRYVAKKLTKRVRAVKLAQTPTQQPVLFEVTT